MWMKNEAQLVEKTLCGDEAAFELLLRPYRKGMLIMAFHLTGNIEEAKEVCQEALIKVFKHLNKFQVHKSFKNWLYKIVTNTGLDFLRKKKRLADIVEEKKILSSGFDLSPEKHLLNREIGDKIESCLKSLSAREKIVFLLRDAEGHSIKETAAMLGSSSMSVRAHLSRARKKIRLQFETIYPLEGTK